MTAQNALIAEDLAPVRRLGGRPSDFTREGAEKILHLIGVGGKSLSSVCEMPGMPHIATVFRWMEKEPWFREEYARAREARAERIFEDTLAIADDGKNDWMEKNDPDNPGYLANGEHIQRSRLRVDTRKWFLARLFPSKFADQQQSSAPGPTINIVSFATAVDARLNDLLDRMDGPAKTIEGKAAATLVRPKQDVLSE